MAFQKKEWLRRIVEFPGRRKITPSGIENVYNIERAEGDVLQAGDGFTKENMDDLEERIAAEFKVTQSLAPTEIIPANSDLDDYVEHGCYRVRNSSDAGTIGHSPVTNQGYMLSVYSIYGPDIHVATTQVVQLYRWHTYSRYRYGNNPWSDWEYKEAPMTGATASAAGKAGLVPAPPKGAQGKVLKGNATWGDAEIAYRGAYADFPATGNPNLLYIDDTVDPHLMYTWNSSTSKYVLTGGAGGADGSSIDIPITLPASGWTGTAAPYSQTVTVPQIRESMTPLLFFSGTGDAAQYAYSLITGYEAGYAQMTFSAADKPQVDIPITLKGIPAQQLEFADNTVVVVVPADGFALNEDVGRYEQTITVEGMTPGMGGMFDIVRSGPVLSVEESKIVSNITDIIRLEDAIKIVCLEPPEQQYMLALYGTFTQATEGTTLLAGMQGWFDKVEELEAGKLFYIDHKIVTKADSGSAPWSAYGTKSIAVASATPVSAQIIGASNFYGSVTLNANSGAVYVYGAIAGEYTIRVLYAHTS